MSEIKNRALFLDRDGVINVDSGYIWRPEDFIFNDGVFEACRSASAMGFMLFVVTNQAGIGRGLYSERDFQALNEWMLGRFREESIEIGRVYFAPTHPENGIGVYRRESPDASPVRACFLRRVTHSISICPDPPSWETAKPTSSPESMGVWQRAYLSKVRKTTLRPAVLTPSWGHWLKRLPGWRRAKTASSCRPTGASRSFPSGPDHRTTHHRPHMTARSRHCQPELRRCLR